MRRRARRGLDAAAWLFVTGIAAAPGAGAQEREVPAIDPAGVRALLDELVPAKMEEYRIPGVTLAVVQGERVLALAGYGSDDLEAGRPVDPQRSLFRVGSVSKAVTATAALVLVEEGGAGLHDDLRPHFRDLPLRPEMDAPLTLHHLLTFTGGFDEELFGQHTVDPARFRTLERFLRDALPPRFEAPGRVIAYNDFQSCLAGLAVERLGGERFEDYVARRLFAPLGMEHSTFDQLAGPPGPGGRHARSYRVDGDRFVPYERDYILTPPAAGLWTTAADMATYLRAILGGLPAAPEVLPASAWRSQITPQFSHVEELPGWGYGFAQDRRKGAEVYFKDGQAWGFHARLLIVPELRLGVFSAINRTILGSFGAFAPASRFNREVGDALLERHVSTAEEEEMEEDEAEQAAPVVPDDVAARLADYTGTYRNTVASRHTFEKLLVMSDDITVGRDDAGHLVMWGVPWAEIRPGVAQYAEGGRHHIAFGDPGPGGYRYLFVARAAYERVPWFATSTGSGRISVAFLVLFAVGGLGFGIVAWRRRRAAGAGGALLPATAAVVSAANLLFYAGFGAIFGLVDMQRFFLGAPPALTVVLALPVLSAAGMLGLAWLCLRGGGERALLRVLATAFLVAAVPFYLWLGYWNLLGWRY